MIKRINAFILSIFIILVLCSCGKTNNANTNIDPGIYDEPNITVNRVDEFQTADMELREISIEDPDALCNTYMDVEPNFTVQIRVSSSYLSATNLQNDIVATDGSGEEVDLSYSYDFSTIDDDDEKKVSRIVTVGSANSDGFERGNAYTISIEKNDNLFFLNKSETVRTVIFSIKDEDRNEFELVDNNYTKYDLDKVSEFQGFGDYNTYLYYDERINESAGSVIVFQNAEEKIYVEVVDTFYESGKTKLYYKAPSADKIFNKADLHIDNKELDIENDFVLNDLKEIARDLLTSDYVLLNCYAVADKYNFSPSVDKFLESAWVDFYFKPKGNQFSLGIEISYTYEFESGWRLCFALSFDWTKSFTASASVKLKTVLGIPTGIDANCSLASDETYTVKFLITLKNKKFNPGYVEDTPKDLDLSRAKKAVQELKDKWADAEMLGYKRDKVVGDTLMVNIGYISFHLGYVSLDIDVYMCLKLNMNITLGVSYQYSSHQVLINYSSSDGNGDGGLSPSKVSASTLTGSLAGNINAEAFLKVRATLYITGLKYLLSFSVDADAGAYFNMSGLGSLGYDFATDQFEGNLGSELEFGFFFRVTLNVNALWFIHGSWELFTARAPLLKLGYNIDVNDRYNYDTIELTKNETNISDTNLLLYDVFDSKALASGVKKFSYDEQVVWLDSIFCSAKKYNVVDSITVESEGDNVKIENGKIIVAEGTAEASGKFIVKIKTSALTTRTDEVNFHYVSSDAKYVTFDGDTSTRKAYLPGQQIEFPTDNLKRDGYIFKGWDYDGKRYITTDYLTMGNEDINFTSFYVLDELYTVKFYDGLGNLIKEEVVRNYSAATLPTDDEIYKNMSGYEFVCWDKDLSCVTSDLDVYGIYERRGDLV